MKKYILTTFLFLAVAIAAPVFASEQTGTISTGVETGINGMVVVESTANPSAGSYSGTQTVVLTGGAGTQSIHYSTDGTTPSCTDTNVYTGGINVASTMTIKAISCYPQGVASPVASFTYTIGSAPSGGGGGGGGGGTPPPVTYDADFNDDGKVDIFDLNILTSNWNSTTATNTTGDATGDGIVDIFDLNVLTTTWTG